eukprot:11085940-Karenia_brevis.AAC.1
MSTACTDDATLCDDAGIAGGGNGGNGGNTIDIGGTVRGVGGSCSASPVHRAGGGAGGVGGGQSNRGGRGTTKPWS